MKMTTGKIVRQKWDLAALPSLTARQEKELAALRLKPDDQIDLGDIPEISVGQWETAVRGRFYRPVKQQITARVDADVLAWLKSQGTGYQARMNAILRREMLAAVKPVTRKRTG